MPDENRIYVLERCTMKPGMWHGYIQGGLGVATRADPVALINVLDAMEDKREEVIAEINAVMEEE